MLIHSFRNIHLAATCLMALASTSLAAPPRMLKDLEYAQVESASLKLDLYLPAETTTPPPVVVWVHGGAWRSGSKNNPSILPLTENGFAVASIDYRLSLWGVPLRWRTSISVWEPNRRFVDEQERGPYLYWRHLHEFTPEGDGTRMRDQVTYALPFGPLGEIAHALLVKRQLATIFDFREQAILGSLGPAMAEPV